MRDALARGTVDHVIMGAGIDLETRLAIVREVFEHSDHTTVHLKDRPAARPASCPSPKRYSGASAVKQPSRQHSLRARASGGFEVGEERPQKSVQNTLLSGAKGC